jgi:mannose-6-phosphate isomerase
MALPVLMMRPIFVQKLWGGARLAELPAKTRAGQGPPAGAVGEAWEVADLHEGTSFIDGGPLDGVSLRDAVAAHRRALTGPRAQAGADGLLRFPLLVKLIDAADDLSVQVHPDDGYCARHPGTHSKDEAWLVLDVAPGARILHGLDAGIDRAAFERAIADGRADQALREVRPRRGDVIHIPPGTVHAIGRGCLLLEVQEPSDTTFRVFDFNRTDKDGKPRALHTAQALEVTRFGAQPDVLCADAGGGAHLEATRFSLAVHTLAPALSLHSDDPLVVLAWEGDLVVEDATGARPFPRGATCIVPPGVRAQMLARGGPARVAVMAPR